MKKCLIDAGPLIALFDKSDRFHREIKSFMKGYRGRLVTSWAVVTEVLHMLDFNVSVQMDFLSWLERDALEIPIVSTGDMTRMIELSIKHADIPMDFSDATLLILSEKEKIHEIITIDSDFHIYRDRNKGVAAE